MKVVVHSDGGSRGNPGPAAIGVVVEEDTGDRLALAAELGERIGVTTNNVAEYKALIRGLEEAARLGATEVQCLLDSQLVVEQMNGRYKVKHQNVLDLHRRAAELARGFKHVAYGYVPRAHNAEADRLVNAALDGKPVGSSRPPLEQLEFASVAAPPPQGAAIAALSRVFRDAVEIPRGGIEVLNRRLPAGMRYASEGDIWRERWAAAVAVARFAVDIGVVSPDEAAALEKEFEALRPS
ncbi:MAG: reverse transcriptase-like protein [Candidatus Dormibacteria bacterium]